MNKYTVEMLARLRQVGISYEDAMALRRIAMTLHRWHELECGDSNDYASWAIARGDYVRPEGPPKPNDADVPILCRPKRVFVYDDNGKPYLERHVHSENKARYETIPDRERGAQKRGLQAYVQTDPRGAPLYILRPNDVPEGQDVDACYDRGIAVHK